MLTLYTNNGKAPMAPSCSRSAAAPRQPPQNPPLYARRDHSVVSTPHFQAPWSEARATVLVRGAAGRCWSPPLRYAYALGTAPSWPEVVAFVGQGLSPIPERLFGGATLLGPTTLFSLWICSVNLQFIYILIPKQDMWSILTGSHEQ
jgi:hypothetical protein